ncbi:MAG: hypothetical protein AAB383_01440 [Patescibacteria group bacterium]
MNEATKTLIALGTLVTSNVVGHGARLSDDGTLAHEIAYTGDCFDKIFGMPTPIDNTCTEKEDLDLTENMGVWHFSDLNQ